MTILAFISQRFAKFFMQLQGLHLCCFLYRSLIHPFFNNIILVTTIVLDATWLIPFECFLIFLLNFINFCKDLNVGWFVLCKSFNQHLKWLMDIARLQSYFDFGVFLLQLLFEYHALNLLQRFECQEQFCCSFVCCQLE